MVTLKKYQNKKIAVYGMGLTGCSVAKTLKKLGGKIFCWDDDKEKRELAADEKLLVKKFDSYDENFFENLPIGLEWDRTQILL